MGNLRVDAKKAINELLIAVGWILDERFDFDRTVSFGVAVREFQPLAAFCDYLIFIGGKTADVLEAKDVGHLAMGSEWAS